MVEVIVAEDDTVAVRYVDRGTSLRPFMGHPATGKSYEVVAMEWFVLRDGLIHRRWGLERLTGPTGFAADGAVKPRD